MSEIRDNWERLLGAVLRKVEDLELCYASSRSPSISSRSSSDFSSSILSFRLEIQELQSSDFSSSFRSCLENGELQSSDFSPSFRSCVEIEELQSSDISPSFGSCVEIEELQSPNISPSIGSCLEIVELATDESVRSSDSREDQTTREIITVPPPEDRITRISESRENKMTFSCFPIFRGIFQRRDAMISVHQGRAFKVVVFKLAVADDKSKQKAMNKVSKVSGVESLALDMKDKKLTVVGDIDPVVLVRSLRKLWHTEILSVGPAKEPSPKR